MSVHASDRKRRPPRPGRQALAALLGALALAAPVWSWTVAALPADARPTVALAVGAFGLALGAAVTAAAHHAASARAAREEAARAGDAARSLEHEAALLADRLLPALAEGARGARSAGEVIAEHPEPGHDALQRLVRAVGAALDAADARADRDRARLAEVEEQVAALDREGLDLMAARIAQDRVGAPDALADALPPVHERVAGLRAHVLRELLAADRRSASAMEAAAASGARLQAHLTTLLAKLRDLQDRYGDRPDIFGDLLDIDHGVARTGRLADALVVLARGRSGRRWTRPIVMESILRGAMGRISAYRRVRLHNTSTATIAGYAAEGLMQALAEIMDNAANFSAHGTEVHVYVQEEDTGLTITVEDSGLGMRVRERRLAESLVGGPRDLSTLRGTRMGLAVVGRLAAKHGLLVSFRPSARGGVGVVVLVPPHLVADALRAADGLDPVLHVARLTPAGPPVGIPVPDDAGAAPVLPRRRRGQTFAAAVRDEPRQVPRGGEPSPPEAAGDPGSRFAAFRNAGGGPGAGAGPGGSAGPLPLSPPRDLPG